MCFLCPTMVMPPLLVCMVTLSPQWGLTWCEFRRAWRSPQHWSLAVCYLLPHDLPPLVLAHLQNTIGLLFNYVQVVITGREKCTHIFFFKLLFEYFQTKELVFISFSTAYYWEQDGNPKSGRNSLLFAKGTKGAFNFRSTIDSPPQCFTFIKQPGQPVKYFNTNCHASKGEASAIA